MSECQEEWIHMLAGARDFELSLGLDTKRDYGEACNAAYRFGYEETRLIGNQAGQWQPKNDR